MRQIDRTRLIGEMASRYGIRLDANDPALAIISLNQLAFETAIQDMSEQLRTRIGEFEASAEKIEIRAGVVLAQQVKESAAELRRELHGDVQAASLKCRELLHQVHEANRRPALLRWAAIGVIFGFILFLCGVWVGRMIALGWGRAWF
jgi:hypothetical protein